MRPLRRAKNSFSPSNHCKNFHCTLHFPLRTATRPSPETSVLRPAYPRRAVSSGVCLVWGPGLAAYLAAICALLPWPPLRPRQAIRGEAQRIFPPSHAIHGALPHASSFSLLLLFCQRLDNAELVPGAVDCRGCGGLHRSAFAVDLTLADAGGCWLVL